MSAKKNELGVAVGSGLVAGVIGGAVLTLWLLLTTIARGQDLWMVLKGASTPFLGQQALQPGFDLLAVLAGISVHFLISMGWGVLFSLIAFGWSRPVTLLAGLPFGIAVWLVMYYLMLPLVGMGQMVREVPLGPAIFSHVLFGVAVAAGMLPFQRRARPPARVPA